MNIVPFVAYQMTAKRGNHRGYHNAKPDPFCTVMAILVMVMCLTILVVLMAGIFAEYEIVDTTVMTVTNLTANRVPKNDEFYVSLSNGETYKISAYTYSHLALGDEVEVSNVIQHSWFGDSNGIKVAGEFLLVR